MDPTLANLNTRSGQLISENSAIPPDIVFKFALDGGEDGEVAAHKMILAMVSDVFQNMFFVHNTVDMSANEMMMEDTTKPPFQMMIDAVYNVKPLKKSLQGNSVREILAVLYLVTKYKISELELAVQECLSSFPITEDNVVEVADDAMEYSTTFGEASQCLLVACAKFLEPKFTDAKYFIRFVAEHGDRMAAVHKLAQILNGAPTFSLICSGCNRVTSECLNGQMVTKASVAIGVKVVWNRDCQAIRDWRDWGTGVVVKKDERKTDHWFIRWENNQETLAMIQTDQDKKQSALATFLTKNSFSLDFWPPKDTKRMASNIHVQSGALLSQSGHHNGKCAPAK